MQISKKQLTPTKVRLTVTADAKELESAKLEALQELAKGVNLSGFRKGHAPAAMVEKAVDQQLLQNNVVDTAVNQLYAASVEQEKLRVAAQPEIQVTKFVPYTLLEFEVEADIIGQVKLPDYKKFKATKQSVVVADDEVEAVLKDLQNRGAERKAVDRAIKDTDEATIDFSGVDAKTNERISGADGNDFPLVIGSGTFIPGFEPELVGLKKGEEKTFTVTFPKDYGAKELQNRKVTFTVSVKDVKEMTPPKLDDAFAATVGPFTKLSELKTDIRKQLEQEKARQAQQAVENDILSQLAEHTAVDIPDSLIELEMNRMDEDEKRNLVYRGQTWQEHLTAEGKTEEEHLEGQRPQATIRVKTGLALGEVAEQEGIQVSQEEFDARISELKKQYTDEQMRTELDKPENQRDILSRMLTEKTIAALLSYAT